jgi:hypothetical protein
MKTVNEVMAKAKGEGNENKILTGKGAFSQAGFGDLVNALVNDTTYTVNTYDKEGNVADKINLSEMIRADLKKTLENAKYPQKSESSVLDTVEISTKNIAKAIPYIVSEQIRCGKKFDIPAGPKTANSSVYLADVEGRTKEVDLRDPRSQEIKGTVTIKTKDSVAVKVKSPVPEFLTQKTRKDTNGKVID